MEQDEKKDQKIDEPEVEPEIIEIKEVNTPTERENTRLMTLLGSLQIGWKIAIIRTAPSWCRGHLETIDVYGPDETVDIQYLINTWGGQRLLLKVHKENGEWLGGGSVSLFSYPPKVQGELITMPMLNRQMGINDVQMQSSSPPQQQIPQGSQIDLMGLVKMMTGSKKEEQALLLQLIEKQNKTNPQTPPVNQISSMMEQMMGMFAAFGKMKEVFSGEIGSAQSGGGGEESMIPMISELIKGVMARPKQAPQQTMMRGPGTIVPPGGKHIQAPPPNGAPPQSSQPKPVENLDDLVKQLTSLSPNDAADVVSQMFGEMPEDKRTIATTRFMNHMTGESELDDQSDDDDTIDQYEDANPPDTGK